MLDINWHEMFVPANAILEMVVRGTIMYLALFALLRFIGRRQTGSLGTADVLVVVLLADAAQNGMANEYRSITEGLVLVSTILGWDYVIDWLAYRSAKIRKILEPPALPLVRAGRIQRRNLQREMITIDELMSQIRESGVASVADVRLAQLESDGRISVIRQDEKPSSPRKANTPGT